MEPTAVQSPTTPRPMMQWAGVTHQGPRAENQDAMQWAAPSDPRLDRQGVLLVVCDGVGGEQGGRVAATLAAKTVLDTFYASGAQPQAGAIERELAKAVRMANAAVRAESAQKSTLAGMATTLVLAHVIHNDDGSAALTVVHVGDSRCYHMRNGVLARLTNDHNWVFEQVQAGAMTVEEARNSNMRNMITRSLGASANGTPDELHIADGMKPGDRLLLCTDGLHGALDENRITEVLRRVRDPKLAAEELVQIALTGTTDNTTAVVLNYGEPAVGASQTRFAATARNMAMPATPSAPIAAHTGKTPLILASLLGLLLVAGMMAWLMLGRGNGGTSNPTPPPPAPSATVQRIEQERLPTSIRQQPQPTSVIGGETTPATSEPIKAADPTATLFVPTHTFTPVPPTRTPIPSNTPLPMPTATHTPVPLTATFTAVPATRTPLPSPTRVAPTAAPNNGGGNNNPPPPPPPPPPPTNCGQSGAEPGGERC